MALPADFSQHLLRVAAFVGNTEDALTVQSEIDAAIAAAVAGGLTVINKTGGTLAKGKAIAVGGFDTTSGFFTAVLADASTKKLAVGVLGAALTDGSSTTLYTSQSYAIATSGLNTSGGAIGDPIYLSTSGALSLTAPAQGSGSLVQQLGTVKTVAANGSINVFAFAPIPPTASATNAVPGLATAAQITALEGLQKGLPTVETVTGSTALSLTAEVSFLNPSGTATYTLAAGSNGQRKFIQLCATHSVTVSGIGGGWTGGTAGDWVEVVYSTLLTAWTITGQYVD